MILSKRAIAEGIFSAFIEAPLVARAARPGQFVIISVSDSYGERIPLTIAGSDASAGAIRLIWQRVGKTTAELADLAAGSSIAVVAGPLGRPAEIKKFGTVVCAGGGIGSAPLLPIASALKNAGNTVLTILGARSKSLLILEDEFSPVSNELVVVTDDGSYGRRGLVTGPLEELCSRRPRPDKVFAIGPPIMMKACCELTRRFDIPTEVSLNTIMVDGTGMCGGCRVEVDSQVKFVCVDGPHFDGHKVNFDLMIKRLDAYKKHERLADENYKKHRCRIGLDE